MSNAPDMVRELRDSTSRRQAAVTSGIAKQLERDGRKVKGQVGVIVPEEQELMIAEVAASYGDVQFWDDLSGETHEVEFKRRGKRS